MAENRRRLALVTAVAVGALLAGCAETEFAVDAAKSIGKQSAQKTPQGKGSYYKLGSPYKINGVWYHPEEDYTYDRTGVASWYGPGFHGRLTANGEIYDENDVTAAHTTLPLPSLVRVTNLDNGRELVVRLNDRGPYADDRIIDLSRRSAQLLGIEKAGLARVRVQILETESRQLAALARQGITDMTQLAKAEDEAVVETEVVVAGQSAEPASSGNYVTVPPKETFTSGRADSPVQVASVTTASAPKVATAPIAAVETQELAPLPGTTVAAPQPIVAAAITAAEPVAPAVVAEPLDLTPAPVVAARPQPAAQPQYAWGEGNMAPVVDGPGPKAVAAPRVIEAVATTRADGSATIVAASGATFYIQAGAFSVQQNADAARSKLSAIGPTLVTPVTVGEKQLYRVRVGPVTSPEEANLLLQQVIGAGIADARIVAETAS